MRLISLTCNHCGAPLEVPANTRFVTCAYCSARLQIHRSGNAVYSEVLDEIDKRTERMADDLETIKLQNDLEALDRQWIMAREDFKVRGRDGEYRVPSKAGSVIGLVFVTIFGIFWTGTALKMGAPGIFPLFGVAFVAFAIIVGVMGMAKAQAYEENRKDYERRRRELLRELRDRE
jgi:hypothetical protein